MKNTLSKIIITIPIFFIKIYQKLLSPIFGSCCRFYPSCSNYYIEALKQHGIMRGSWIGIKRILSCHPYSKGGYDPIKIKSK